MSDFGKINWLDLGKGAIVALITVILTAVYAGLTATPPAIPATWAQWTPILTSGVTAAIAYLMKNLFQNSNGTLGKEA